MSCPSIGPKQQLFWTQLFWTGTNVWDTVQNVKFSSEKLFLVLSNVQNGSTIIWTGPKQYGSGPKSFWTYRSTRNKSHKTQVTKNI